MYRAADQYGQVIDVLLSRRRDAALARAFFTCALRCGPAPADVVTDRAPVYPRVVDEVAPTARHADSDEVHSGQSAAGNGSRNELEWGIMARRGSAMTITSASTTLREACSAAAADAPGQALAGRCRVVGALLEQAERVVRGIHSRTHLRSVSPPSPSPTYTPDGSRPNMAPAPNASPSESRRTPRP